MGFRAWNLDGLIVVTALFVTSFVHLVHVDRGFSADQVVAVFSAAQPPPKWALLDRYLVQAEASGLPAIICITKADLVQPGSYKAARRCRNRRA